MKSSKKVKFRNLKNLRFVIATATALLISAVLVTFLFSSATTTAFAEPAPLSDNTFSVLFPTVNYVQSDNPTLIAKNGTYLIIYDKTAKTMFVREEDKMGTYAFSLPLENVEYINAVGNTAFIYADKEYYTVDLKDSSSLPVKRELSSPDNANYFRSDGKYLYAKNGSGAVSIYDENLEIVSFDLDNDSGAITVDGHNPLDDTRNPMFAGDIVLAGNDHLLYFFKTKDGAPEFVVYDPVTQRELGRESMSNYVGEAYVGNNIIVGQLARNKDDNENTRLIGIDINTGATLFPSDITPDSFCVYGDRLYTIEGKQIMTYTLEKSGGGKYTGFRKMLTLSMSGNDSSHLDSPSDVASLGSDLVVADADNNRIGFINSVSVMTATDLGTSSPLRLATDTTGVYALCKNNTVVKVENGAIMQSINAENVIDITYLDKLYLLTPDGLYTVLGGEMLKLADTQGAKRLTSAKDGTNLYLLKDECIEVYSSSGKLICSLLGDFTAVKDISVDYAGQIFALREDGFDVYTNNNGELNLSSSTEFYNENAHASANSLCINGNSLYFSTEECLIGKSQVIAYSKENYTSVPFVPSADATYHFAKLKENVSSYIIPSDGRMEGLGVAPTETILVFDGVSADGLSNALLNGSFFKIIASDYENVEIGDKQGDYATINNTSLYSLPGVALGKITALAGTRFALISDCADFENSKWLRVNYNDKTYFVSAEECAEYVELIPEEDKEFGRAKAKRVGGLVNVYADVNTDSEILLSIVDGTKVEVLEKLDRYYLIRYENTVGYMLKTEVVLDGLTTVQIVAIVVACLVAIAGIGIFVAIEITKKKALEAERKAEKKQK